MRTIWLVRHGAVDFGELKGRVCLGWKDLPLSEEGEWQARHMAEFFKDIKVRGIFSSPLKRAARTAELITAKMVAPLPDVVPVPDLKEVDVGLWDGLSFEEIRERFPEEYQAREKALGRTPFPGGESIQQAGERFAGAFWKILRENEGDLLITAHAGVISALLCRLTGTDIDRHHDFFIPYLGLTELRQEEPDGVPVPVRIGCRPVGFLKMDVAESLWEREEVPGEIRRHLIKVAETALELIGCDPAAAREDRLPSSVSVGNAALDPRVLWYAALLHDLRRPVGRTHPQEGAELLRKEGYLELVQPVALHHEASVWKPQEPLSEAELLYYADKLVQGDKRVSLEERFAQSRKKCAGPDALAAHEQRYRAAKGIEAKLRSG